MNNALETYRASDRRVYNGALCTDMQRESDRTTYLYDRMKKADPSSDCTYFPVEDKYLTFTNSRTMEFEGPPKILTGNFHYDKQSALIEAIIILEKLNLMEEEE